MAACCVAVAYSGGRDSTALLHATVAAAQAQGLRVVALHVHHGLHPGADAWLQHCEAECRRRAALGQPLAFATRRLTARPAPGDSIEAWARRERYRALREMALAQGATLVLLAHHRRDQAETFMLQALRGAGVAGLSGMPREVRRAGVLWVRPWLDLPRTAIEAYVAEHGLTHVDDTSNADPRFARNRLRLQVWPALEAGFPQAEPCLAAAAAWAQQASACLDELARMDLAGGVSGPKGLHLAGWARLSPARQSNALRAWLKSQGVPSPPAQLVERLLHEAVAPGNARWQLAGRELRRYRGWLAVVAPAAALQGAPEAELSIRRAGRHRVPGWAGTLLVERVASGGIALRRLASVRAVGRAGGERFQIGPGRPARTLKKQYQALAVPEWERDGPLLFCDDELVFAAGLGVDARAVAPQGEVQVRLRWMPDASPAP